MEARIFAHDISHPEDIAIGSDGSLYCGTAAPEFMDPGPILKVSPDGSSVETFADTGGRVLGLEFGPDGWLYACDTKQKRVVRISPQGQVQPYVVGVLGKPLQMPNYLVFDREGGFYLSDSGTAKAGETTGAVYYIDANGHGEVVAKDLVMPNGLALSADGSTLFCVLTRDDKIVRIPLEGPGRGGVPEEFCDGLTSGPDGIALDEEGFLYCAITRSHRVVRIAPDGSFEDFVSDNTQEVLHMPSNVRFGGPDGKTLYIANLFGQHLSVAEAPVAGLIR